MHLLNGDSKELCTNCSNFYDHQATKEGCKLKKAPDSLKWSPRTWLGNLN